MKSRIEGIIHDLSRPENLYGQPKALAKLEKIVSSMKKKYADKQDEANASLMWCLGGTIAILSKYFEAFGLIKTGKFYDGWCALEQAEIALIGVKKHLDPKLFNKLQLDEISTKIEQWQSLFPYKLFFSPELVAKEKKCSICGKPMGIRNRCEHIVGELYGGEVCHRIVTKVEFIGIGLVENPVQKYSVPFLGEENGEKRDHYDYTVVGYAAKAVANPFISWSVHKTKVLHPHSLYSDHLPDDPCPCECEEKLSYKDCCLKREGVIRPHLQFHVTGEFPKGLPPVMFSSDLRSRMR